MSTAGWVPPQWSRGPAMISVTQVPTQGQSNFSGFDAQGNFVLGGSGSTAFTYVFDAVLTLEHEQRLEKTQHPVQTGAAISSHAYLMPARLTMEIGMSDAMAAFSNGQNSNGALYAGATPSNTAPFTGSSYSKSVNAYQTLLALQAARQPLTITTRLRTYVNMVVVNALPREDHRTITGLRARVEFEQIITGQVSTTPYSARPDSTVNTGLGSVNPAPVPQSVQTQYQVPQASVSGGVTSIPPATPETSQSVQLGLTPLSSMVSYLPQPVNVPGAGSYSSSPGQTSLP